MNGIVCIDFVIVGGGYVGLWIVVCVKECDFGCCVVLLEVLCIVWVVFGCNGGFCELSFMYGYENGVNCWLEEIDWFEELGYVNFDGIEEMIECYGMDVEFECIG